MATFDPFDDTDEGVISFEGDKVWRDVSQETSSETGNREQPTLRRPSFDMEENGPPGEIPAKNVCVRVDTPTATLATLLCGKVHGECLARVSARTITFKVWKEIFWVFEQQNVVLLFRQRADYLDYHSNPFLSKQEREYLIKKKIKLEGNLRCLPISRKKYRRQTQLYYFALEAVHDYGPIVVAKFGALQNDILEDLRLLINQRIQKMRHQNLNKKSE